MRHLFALLISATLLACTHHETQATEAPPAAAQPPVRFIDRSLPKTTLEAASVADQAAVIEAQLRLRPDRRFVMAVGDVHELLTGTQVTPEIDWTGREWSVTAAGAPLGTLPELATFRDGLMLLERLATRLGAKKPAATPDARAFYAEPLFAALKNADPAASAEAAALINYQLLDRLGLADPLRARGLALLAIARAAGVPQTEDLVTMMATSLGYDNEGGTPKTLSPAAKQWIETRDRVLATEHQARSGLLGALPAHAMPLFIGKLDMHDDLRAATAAAQLIAAEVSGDRKKLAGTAADAFASPLGEELGQAFSVYERNVTAHAGKLASKAFPAPLVESYYHAMFHSALYELYDGLVFGLGSRQSAESFVKGLEMPVTPTSTQARDWLRFAVAARYERGGGITPLQAMARTPFVGGAARAWMLRQYANSLGAHDRNLRQATRTLFPHLDTRPAELFEAGRLAQTTLSDPSRFERYFGAAVERSAAIANHGTRAWYYALIGDTARLRAIATDRSASTSDRAVALTELGGLPDADHAMITSTFAALITEDDYRNYAAYAGYLNERRNWTAKERAARQWLATRAEGKSPIETAYYASSLADALERQGRYEEAWKVLEPHVGVWSANVISGAMSVMERRGEVEPAIALGKQYIERYPGADPHADLARIYWRRRHFSEAADLFDRSYRLDYWGLRTVVPEAFVETFESAPPADAAAAIEALTQKGVEPWLVLDILSAARERNQHALVITLVDKLVTLPGWHAGTPNGATAINEGWRALKTLKGTEIANAWLRPRVPDAAALQFVSATYQDEQYDLVLEYATARPDQLKSIEMLSFVTAALTHLRVPENDPRLLLVRERVTALGSQPKTLLPVAQYLLGMMPEDEFLRWPYQPEGRAVAAYFVGLKSARDGNYDKALPWLLAAREGADTNPPAVWAAELLTRWAEAKKSWKEIAREGML